jgi:hypothetical protein
MERQEYVAALQAEYESVRTMPRPAGSETTRARRLGEISAQLARFGITVDGDGSEALDAGPDAAAAARTTPAVKRIAGRPETR